MIWSDPPYGLGGYAGRTEKFDAVAGDDFSDDKLHAFYCAGNAAEVYVCCEWKTYPHLLAARGEPRSLIVWAKNNFGMGNGYRRQHEFIGYYGNYSGTTESDLWEISRDSVGSYDHPTQKPVALPARAICNSTRYADVVFDPFGGVGCSMVACEQLRRQCRMIEIEPKYCAVILERMAALGLEPRKVNT